MKKRSALAMAGGVVAALMAAVVAISINLGIVGAAGKPNGPGNLETKPIVKTIRKTERIRKPARHVTVGGGAQPSGASVSSSGSGVASSEDHDGYEDHGEGELEHEGHEDEHEYGEADDD